MSNRVALVVEALRPGGVETFLFHLGAGLKQHGLQTEIVTTGERGPWFDTARALGIETRQVTSIDGGIGLLRAVSIAWFLRRSGYQAVLLNHDRYAQAALSLLPDSVIAVPIVHNDTDECYEVACANRDAWNALVAVSPRVQRRAQAKVGTRPCVFIPHGVPTVPATSDGRTAQTPFQLLFVGRLQQSHKGVLLLPGILQAVTKQGVDARLTVIGRGPDRPQLLERFREAGVLHLVHLEPEVPPGEVLRTMRNAHVLLLPSYHEGLPMVLLEAQACGCVPIAARLEGITDYALRDGETGILVSSYNPNDYALAVETLADARNLWAAMSRNAGHWVKENFDVNIMVRRYADLIAAAVNGRFPLPVQRKTTLRSALEVLSWKDLVPASVRTIGRSGRSKLFRHSAGQKS